MTDQPPARTVARRRLQALGLTEHQAVAVLLPVIAETYREVADDAEDGAHGGTWGETVPEALTSLAAAYRRMAADCDLPGAPMPEVSPALARERAAHEEHRRAVCDALGNRTELGMQWDMLIKYADGAHKWATDAPVGRNPVTVEAKDRAEAAEAKVADYENRLNWETNCGEHARLLDACAAADERAEKAEAALDGIRKAARLHRQGLLGSTGLHAAIGPFDGDDQPAETEAPCFHPSWETHASRRQCTDCGEWLDPEPQQPAALPYGPIEAAADLLLTAARALHAAITPPDRQS